MLSDAKLKSLKPRQRSYKIADRDGMYVQVLPTGTISFRYNYRVNGRQETVVLGQYGPHGLSLSEAREKFDSAKKALSTGVSPARHKGREKDKVWQRATFPDSSARLLS